MKKRHKLLIVILSLLMLVGCSSGQPAETEAPAPEVTVAPTPEPTPPPKITISDIMEKYIAVSKSQIVENPGKFFDDLMTVNYYQDVTAKGWIYEIEDWYSKEFELATVNVELLTGESGETLTCKYYLDMSFLKSSDRETMFGNIVAWGTEKFGEPDFINEHGTVVWEDKLNVLTDKNDNSLKIWPYLTFYTADSVVTNY